MTNEQIEAIQQWAKRHGRKWKSALRDAWMSGDYDTFEQSAELQRIRNEYGPTWLVAFRLSKVVEVSGQSHEATKS